MYNLAVYCKVHLSHRILSSFITLLSPAPLSLFLPLAFPNPDISLSLSLHLPRCISRNKQQIGNKIYKVERYKVSKPDNLLIFLGFDWSRYIHTSWKKERKKEKKSSVSGTRSLPSNPRNNIVRTAIHPLSFYFLPKVCSPSPVAYITSTHSLLTSATLVPVTVPRFVLFSPSVEEGRSRVMASPTLGK